MTKLKGILKNTDGDAVVEATILFPIMIMIFAALVLLAMYLPTRAALQRATQLAATVIATERSDTWLRFSENGTPYWVDDIMILDNVYITLWNSIIPGSDCGDKAERIVRNKEGNIIKLEDSDLNVEFALINHIVYKEIIVTATRIIPMPIDLSFIRFPREIPITVTSTAVVQNGDEFVRNVDIAVDVVNYITTGNPIAKLFENVLACIGMMV